MTHPIGLEIRKKLDYLLGREKAPVLIAETLARIGLVEVRTPDDAYRFAVALMRRGGVFEAAGRAIKIQAILNGARDSEAA